MVWPSDGRSRSIHTPDLGHVIFERLRGSQTSSKDIHDVDCFELRTLTRLDDVTKLPSRIAHRPFNIVNRSFLETHSTKSKRIPGRLQQLAVYR